MNYENFPQNILDCDNNLSLDFVKKKKWCALLHHYSIGYREAEWLSAAVHSLDCYKLISYEFSDQDKFSIKVYSNKASEILKANENLSDFLIITNENQDFLYYKNSVIGYYIIFSNYDFSYKCSQSTSETIKEIFFFELEKNNDQLSVFILCELWKKYVDDIFKM